MKKKKTSSKKQRKKTSSARSGHARSRAREKKILSLLAAQPDRVAERTELIQLYLDADKLSKAAEQVFSGLKLNPRNPDLLFAAGIVQKRLGNSENAEQCFQEVLKIAPEHYKSLRNLANIFLEKQQWNDVLPLLNTMEKLQPGDSSLYFFLGTVHLKLRNLETALQYLLKAREKNPSFPDGIINLGTVYAQLREFERAESLLLEVHRLAPLNTMAIWPLVDLYVDMHRFDDALILLEKSAAIDSQNAYLYFSFGYYYLKTNRITKAEQSYRKALQLDPAMVRAWFGLALSLLIQGDFHHGLACYEKRYAAHYIRLDGTWPVWDTKEIQTIRGKRVLVRCEQGAGDTFQFCRLLPLFNVLGPKEVIFSCPPSLGKLMESLQGVDTLISTTPFTADADYQVPLMSLLGVLNLTLETIPQDCPYVSVSDELIAEKKNLLKQTNAPKVGLIWAGSPEHTDDHNRSMHLCDFAVLADLRDTVDLYSLQMGPQSSQLDEYGEALGLTDLSSYIEDYADTAAFMECMDVIVSVDTSTIHLAGALGRPAILLLPFAGEWRWLLDREDSPWYPTLRLFRQETAGDWGPVVGRVKEELQQLSGK